MAKANMKVRLAASAEQVWKAVTDNKNYAWRSDLSRIEEMGDGKTFVEYTKSGFPTTFTITKKVPFRQYEFDIENENMKGHWTGLFRESGNGTEMDFTEDVELKKPFLKFAAGNSMWWITDMGTNLLIPFNSREYDIYPLIINDSEEICVNVGDRTSSYTGIIKTNALIQEHEKNKFIAAYSCGSYTFSCAPNFIYPLSYYILMVDEENINILQKGKNEEEYIARLFD